MMPEQQEEVLKAATGSKPVACDVDLEKCSTRLKRFYDHWKDYKFNFWGGSDAIIVAAPPSSRHMRNFKSSAIYIWLLGYVFPESVILFMGKEIHFLCSEKEADVLGTLEASVKEAIGADIVMHIKGENDSGAHLMESILLVVFSHSQSRPPIVGHISKELPQGNLLALWFDKLERSSVELTDVTNGFSELFAVKDGDELACVKKAAYLTMSIMENYVVPKLTKIIEEEKNISHSTLTKDTVEAILDPHHPLKTDMNLKAENIDVCYPPIFQSGAKFDLKPSALSNDDDLFYGSDSVIICAIGTQYSGYCTNIARTYFFDAMSSKIKAYETLLKAHNSAIAALKPGERISAAFQAAAAVVKHDAPELLPNLAKTAGTGIGLEFQEFGLSINAKNDRVVKTGMVFNVALGFHNLEAGKDDQKTNIYSLLISDTVIVDVEAPEVLTSSCGKSIEDVEYGVDEVEEEVTSIQTGDVSGGDAQSDSSTAACHPGNREILTEELQRQHEAELARQKNEETATSLLSDSAEVHKPASATNEMSSYKNVNDLPVFRDMVTQFDEKNDAILLPIYAAMVPFHVFTVKSVSFQQARSTCIVRIMFNAPGISSSPQNDNSQKYQDSIYLKQITILSRDPSNMVGQKLNTLKRFVDLRKSERDLIAALVTQAQQQLKRPKLQLTCK